MKLDQKALLTGSSSPEQLRADIEETRERLAQIADKLTPRAILAAQAKQAIDDARAAVSDRAGDVIDTVSDRAGDVLDTVSDRAGEVINAVSDRADEIAAKAPEMASQAAEEANARKLPLAAVGLALLAAIAGVVAARRG
jgi:cell division septum initiation protein DivIVA